MSLKSLKNQTLRNKSTINSVNLTGGASTGPVITSIVVTDSNYNNLDDTALLPAGGYAKLIGSGFASGCSAYFNGSSVTTTFVSATEVRVVIPATSVGTYNVMLFNPSTAGAIYLNLGISSAPTFTTTAGSLGTSYETTAVSTSIAATGDAPITYALYSGSLPTGVTLASNGTLSGTSPVEASSTTYSFIVQATDAQLQDTTRSFSLTISTDVVTWSTPAADFAYTLVGNEAMANVSLLATSAAGYGVTYAANTLPTGVSLSGNTVFGTPTTEQTIYTALTATANTTGRTATRYVSWSVVLGDAFWKYNTLLIPGASTTFVDDASTNNFAVTINGDTRPNSFSPYTAGYYSNFFDGSGDWLTFPNNAGYEFGSGAFTVELWAYITGSSGTVANYSNGQSSNSNFAWELYQVSTTVMQFSVFEGATQYISSSSAFKTNSWNHIACVRSGNTLTTYVNGVAGGTTANITGVSISAPAAATLKLCSYGNGSSYLTGYISNFRVVKGTAVYTAAFTPSTTPLTAITNTSLLTCQSNRFIDNSTNNFTITVTGNTLISSFDPFVPNSSYSTYGSGYFDGTGDYLSVPSNAAFDLGASDFTIECWFNPQGFAAAYGLISRYNYEFVGSGWFLRVVNSTTIRFAYGNDVINNVSVSLSTNIWYHLALSRSGTTAKMFLNGIQVGSFTVNNFSDATTALQIGRTNTLTDDMYTYMTDVRVVKGTAVYTTAFTPPVTPLTAIANTSLLTLQNNQPVNNNTFLDNSTNNFLVTRAGNATQGTFSPYGGNWSNFFNGSTDYLSVSNNAALMLGAGNFTIECWFYITGNSASNPSSERSGQLITKFQNTSNYYTLYVLGNSSTTGNALRLEIVVGGSLTTIQYTGTIAQNQWQHFAVVRNGSGSNNIVLYLNGSSVATGTNTATDSNTGPVYIGYYGYPSYPNYFNGYISNARIVKGTAVYTGNFTPSTTPLTPIANTSLLTCADSRFIDDSLNAFALTTTGTPSIQRFSPFNPSSVTPTSYSGYFDGTGDVLTPPANNVFAFGTGSFCIEAWIFNNELKNYSCLVTTRPNNSSYADAYHIGWDSVGGVSLYVNTTSTTGAPGGTITTGQWQHFVCCRDSSNRTAIFVNGTRVGSDTVTSNFTRNLLGIGDFPTTPAEGINGYISNLRLVKGNSVYDPTQTTITVPTSPLTTTSQGVTASTVSILTCQSTTFIDNSTNNFTITAVGNTQPTQQNPFGFTSATTNGYTVSTIGGSGYFDGTGDYLTAPSDAAYQFGTGDFTIEYWIYQTASGSYRTVLDTRSSGTASPWACLINSSNQPYILITADLTSSIAITINAWNHVVCAYNGAGQVKFYVNGSLVGTSTASWTDAGGTTGTYIGAYSGVAYFFNGTIDEAGAWTRALTATEVTELYNSGNGKQYPL